MDRTRRSLMKAGLVSLPVAVVAPRILAGEERVPAPVAAADRLLTHLVADTKQNCRLAQMPGRRRAAALRALGADLEAARSYVLAHRSSEELKAACASGNTARLGPEAWRRMQSQVHSQYGVSLPGIDAGTFDVAAEGCRQFGLPSTTRVRFQFEMMADHLDMAAEPIGGVITPQQTPGNDFGPWAIGTGDPGFGFNCQDTAILASLLALLAVLFPELRPAFELAAACLGVALTTFCMQP